MIRNIVEHAKTYLAIILLIMVVVYIIFNSRILIAGPKIIVNTPSNGASFENKTIKIEGLAQNTSFISINDRPITIDEENQFSETLLLIPGYNIITIRAKDKFERKIIEKMDFFYKEPPDKKVDYEFLMSNLEQATTSEATSTEIIEESLEL